MVVLAMDVFTIVSYHCPILLDLVITRALSFTYYYDLRLFILLFSFF